MKPAFLAELEADDYRREPDSLRVRVPHRVFRLDFEIEENRKLLASEAAVLGCIANRPSSPAQTAHALGLPDSRLVETVALRLLKRNAIQNSPLGFELTDAGRELMTAGELRQMRHFQRDVRYLPAGRRFQWFVEHELPSHGEPDLTLEIPLAHDIEGNHLHQYVQDLQRMIEREGIPTDDEATPSGPRDLLSVRLLSERLGTTEAVVELWKQESAGMRLRFLRDGIEDLEASRLYSGYIWNAKARRFEVAR